MSRELELDKLSAQYDPEKALRNSWRWVATALVSLVAVMGLSYAFARGVDRWSPMPHDRDGAELSESVLLVETVGDTALLVVGDGSAFREIKVATTTTDTCVIQDVTRGRSMILSGSLSPTRDRVALVREDEGQRVVVLVDLATGSRESVRSEGLRDQSGRQTVTEPCSWSPIAWVPSGERFGFFGCDRDTSVILVVELGTEVSPFRLKKTEAPAERTRQLSWLDEVSLMYTSSCPETGESEVNRITACPDCVPFLVYKR